MNTALKVAKRFALKYVPKETKKSKVERLMKDIREKTGLSKSISEDVADILVRGRDLEALAVQKNLPVEDGFIKGPKGKVSIDNIRKSL